MENILPLFFYGLIVLSVISTIVIINKNRWLSKREKTNLTFIQILLPLIGPVIYMIYNKYSRTKRVSQHNMSNDAQFAK